jgi:hypothetical protein
MKRCAVSRIRGEENAPYRRLRKPDGPAQVPTHLAHHTCPISPARRRAGECPQNAYSRTHTTAPQIAGSRALHVPKRRRQWNTQTTGIESSRLGPDHREEMTDGSTTRECEAVDARPLRSATLAT